MQEQGLDVAGVACDVTAEAASGSLVTAALDRWGRLDTVVANAGVALDEPGSASVDALDRMFALHVRSVWELANAAVPVIAESGRRRLHRHVEHRRACAATASSRATA